MPDCAELLSTQSVLEQPATQRRFVMSEPDTPVRLNTN